MAYDLKITSNGFYIRHAELPLNDTGRRVFPATGYLDKYRNSATPPSTIVGEFPPDPEYSSTVVNRIENVRRYQAKAVIVPITARFGFINTGNTWQTCRFPQDTIIPIDLRSPLTTISGTDLPATFADVLYWIDETSNF